MKKILMVSAGLLVLLSGCEFISGGSGLQVYYNPNPGHNPEYRSGDNRYEWGPIQVTVEDTSGIGAVFTNTGPSGEALKVEYYPGGAYAYSETYGATVLKSWFGSDTIPAYGRLVDTDAYYQLAKNSGYVIETYYATDTDGNQIQVSGRIDLAP